MGEEEVKMKEEKKEVDEEQLVEEGVVVSWRRSK